MGVEGRMFESRKDAKQSEDISIISRGAETWTSLCTSSSACSFSTDLGLQKATWSRRQPRSAAFCRVARRSRGGLIASPPSASPSSTALASLRDSWDDRDLQPSSVQFQSMKQFSCNILQPAQVPKAQRCLWQWQSEAAHFASPT